MYFKGIFGKGKKRREAAFNLFLDRQKRTLDALVAITGEIRSVRETMTEIQRRSSSEMTELKGTLDQMLAVFGENTKALTQYFRMETRYAEEMAKKADQKPTEHDLQF